MKKIARIFFQILSAILILIATTALIIKDPAPDYVNKDLTKFDAISITDLDSENLKVGNFKSSVNFTQQNHDASEKEFYGQEIRIKHNPNIDRILIGVTNHQTSRIEIWNKNDLIEKREKEFVGKMTWGDTQMMSIEFYDQRNSRYPGKSKISFRFYSGTGFFGDIGTIHFNLSEFGDLTGNKELKLFAKSLESENVNSPEFSELKLWNKYNSFD